MRFKNINIIIRPADNTNYLFFAEFFKLCGVFVVKSEIFPFEEDTRGEQVQEVPERRLDITENWHWTDIVVDEHWQENQKQLLMNAVSSVFMEKQDMVPDSLDVLADAYVKADLVHWNCLERYFYRPTTGRMTMCRSGFFKAVSILQEYGNPSVQNDIWYHYFLINCKNKVNILSARLGRSQPFAAAKLLENALTLALTNEDCRQGFVLAANVADSNWRFYSESCNFYEQAKGLDAFWDAYINYRLGRYYERIEEDNAQALKYYVASRTLAPWNYRSLYKVALLNYTMGNIGEAVVDFLGMDSIFSSERKYLEYQPIHLEYRIKSYEKLMELYQVWLEEPKLVEYMARRIRKLEGTIRNNTFFDKFFRSPENEDWADSEKYNLLMDFRKRKLFRMDKKDDNGSTGDESEEGQRGKIYSDSVRCRREG